MCGRYCIRAIALRRGPRDFGQFWQVRDSGTRQAFQLLADCTLQIPRRTGSGMRSATSIAWSSTYHGIPRFNGNFARGMEVVVRSQL